MTVDMGLDLPDLSAAELSAAIRARRVSCREVMAAHLDRIDRRNPAINAIVSLRDRDDLLAEADARDAELVHGHWRGWMHGLPHAVKDMAATAGLRTTLGSPLLSDFVPRQDAYFVERLRAAGAILIGKTNVPEFGLGSQSYNPVFGVTRNPYDLSRTAGGSSGGAAAALAARLLPVADGSDMMGSLRNPAAFCNVYGFRPSVGRVPAGPTPEPYLQQLSTDGPMARDAVDLALLASTMIGFDARAPMSLPGDGESYARLASSGTGPLGPPVGGRGDASSGTVLAGSRPLAGLRIGWLADWGGHLAMAPGVLQTCEGALRVLASLGAVVEPIAPPFAPDRLWDCWIGLRATLVGGRLAEFRDDPVKRARLKPDAQWEIAQGERATALDFYRHSATRAAWHAAALAAFERVDLMAAPAAQVFPFDAGQAWPREIAGRSMDTYHRWMEVVIAASLLGAPAVSVPAGFGGPHDLPMGLQLWGPPREDLRVLRATLAYDSATRWPALRRPPESLAAPAQVT